MAIRKLYQAGCATKQDSERFRSWPTASVGHREIEFPQRVECRPSSMTKAAIDLHQSLTGSYPAHSRLILDKVPTSASVKGCSMPALERRPARTHQSPVGRRRTNLQGGNRGMPRGVSEQGTAYGDLRRRTRAEEAMWPARRTTGRLMRTPGGQPCRVFSLMHRAGNDVFRAPGNTVPCQCRPLW